MPNPFLFDVFIRFKRLLSSYEIWEDAGGSVIAYKTAAYTLVGPDELTT